MQMVNAPIWAGLKPSKMGKSLGISFKINLSVNRNTGKAGAGLVFDG
jgi:hypothetical protein